MEQFLGIIVFRIGLFCSLCYKKAVKHNLINMSAIRVFHAEYLLFSLPTLPSFELSCNLY